MILTEIFTRIKITHTYGEYNSAAERFIVKLILPPSLVGEARVCEKARLIEKFWDEHDDFKGQLGPFDKSHIWKVAEDPETLAYKWHQRNSLPYT